MNENRQIFVNTYLTNDYNAAQAYKTAYPNCKGGWNKLGHRLLTFDDVKEALSKAKKDEIGINVGGTVYIHSVENWHKLAASALKK